MSTKRFINYHIGKYDYDYDYYIILFTGTEEEFLAIKKFKWKKWETNGKLHRDDGPAVIKSNGYQEWWQNGVLHREDGPAIIDPYMGDIYDRPYKEVWYQNGLKHRDYGPAVLLKQGGEIYFRHGRRIHLPEVIFRGLFNNRNAFSSMMTKDLDEFKDVGDISYLEYSKNLEDKIKKLESRVDDLENKNKNKQNSLEKYKEENESDESTTVLTLLALVIKMFIGPFKIGNRQF